MDPLDRLMEEHRVIERVVDVLEEITNRLNRGMDIDVNDARQVLDFIRIFADKCHHGKEEGVLFPLMEEKGIPREGGPIGVMLEEHEIGRNAVRGMLEAIESIERGDEAAKERFISNAWRYISMIRPHIDKEDNILYQMARSVFNEDDLEKLDREFDRVEREDIGPGVHEKYHELAHKLYSKYFKGK